MAFGMSILPIETLVQGLVSDDPVLIQHRPATAGFLLRAAADTASHPALVEAASQCIPALVAALGSEEEVVWKAALQTLSIAAERRDSRRAIVSAGAVPATAQLVQAYRDDEAALGYAAGMLLSLARGGPAGCQALVDGGALPALVAGLSSADDEAAAACAFALYELVEQLPTISTQVVAAGALEPALWLCNRSHSHSVAHHAATTLLARIVGRCTGGRDAVSAAVGQVARDMLLVAAVPLLGMQLRAGGSAHAMRPEAAANPAAEAALLRQEEEQQAQRAAAKAARKAAKRRRQRERRQAAAAVEAAKAAKAAEAAEAAAASAATAEPEQPAEVATGLSSRSGASAPQRMQARAEALPDGYGSMMRILEQAEQQAQQEEQPQFQQRAAKASAKAGKRQRRRERQRAAAAAEAGAASETALDAEAVPVDTPLTAEQRQEQTANPALAAAEARPLSSALPARLPARAAAVEQPAAGGAGSTSGTVGSAQPGRRVAAAAPATAPGPHGSIAAEQPAARIAGPGAADPAETDAGELEQPLQEAEPPAARHQHQWRQQEAPGAMLAEETAEAAAAVEAAAPSVEAAEPERPTGVIPAPASGSAATTLQRKHAGGSSSSSGAADQHEVSHSRAGQHQLAAPTPSMPPLAQPGELDDAAALEQLMQQLGLGPADTSTDGGSASGGGSSSSTVGGDSAAAVPAPPVAAVAAAQPSPAATSATAASAPAPAALISLDPSLLSDLCCPITHEPMADPVVAADGGTYERAAIEAWIARQRAAGQAPTSPLTGATLQDLSLRPNLMARGLVASLRAAGLLQ